MDVSSVGANSFGAELFQVAILKKSMVQEGSAALELLKSIPKSAEGHVDVYA